MADPINKLQVKNIGDLYAKKVSINILTKQNCFFRQTSTKKIHSLDPGDCVSIYKANNSKFNPAEYNEIKVKINYYSPLHNRKLILRDIRVR